MVEILFPEQKPHTVGDLPVGDGHILRYERYGTVGGPAVVCLHGGPGLGKSRRDPRLFSPAWDVTIFDQRGNGESTPKGELKNNTILKGVGDIETLRQHLGIDVWGVSGGSWGSALAKVYGAVHGDRVLFMILRGDEFPDMVSANVLIRPDASMITDERQWPLLRAYVEHIPIKERENGLLEPYYKRLMSTEPGVAIEAAKKFEAWNISKASYRFNPDLMNLVLNDPNMVPGGARVFWHFAKHEFDDAYRAPLIRAMADAPFPIYLIHGLQDRICLPQNSRDLHEACGGGLKSTLMLLDECGHNMSELPLQAAYVKVSNSLLHQGIAARRSLGFPAAPRRGVTVRGLTL